MLNRKSTRNTVIAAIIIFAVYIAAGSFYIVKIQSSLLKGTEAQLKEISYQIVRNIEFRMRQPLELVTTLSTTSYADPQIPIEKKISEFEQYVISNELLSMGIIDTNYVSHSTYGKRQFDKDNNEWIKRALNGKANISTLQVTDFDGVKIETLFFAAPITYKGKTEQVLFASKDSSTLDQIIRAVPIFGGLGEVYIFTDDGKVLFQSDKSKDTIDKNIYSDILSLENSYTNIQEFKKAVQAKKDTTINILLNEEKYMASYLPVPSVKTWNIIIAIPTRVVLKEQMGIVSSIIASSILIMIIIVILFIIYVKWENKHSEVLYRSAYIDPLTGVFSEAKMKEEISSLIERLKKRDDYTSAPIFTLDIDNFKTFNKVYGTELCDKLLILIAESLTLHFNDTDYDEKAIVGRTKADNFVVIYVANNDIGLLTSKLQRFITDIQNTNIDNVIFKGVTFSIGIAFVSVNDTDPISVLEKADAARRSIKNNENVMYAFYSPEMMEPYYEEEELKNELKQAVENKDFSIFYQPKYNLNTNQICGFEGLIRWEHKEKGFISPAKFIPIAEKSGLIIQIGNFVSERICEDIRSWHEAGLLKGIIISANLSIPEIFQPGFIENVRRMMRYYNVPPRTLEMEITETMAITNLSTIVNIIHDLNELNINVSIDDFGTGNTALTVLKDMPVDLLKLDRSFLTDVEQKDNAREILELIINFAKALDIEVLAEGVENQQQVDILRDSGCYLVQGFFFAKPMPRENAHELLVQHSLKVKKEREHEKV